MRYPRYKPSGDENICRKDFSIAEALALAERLEAIEGEAAKQRQREHGGTAPGKHSGQIALSVNGRTRDRVAAGIGMKPRTYEKAKAVYKAAQCEPERYGKILERMERSGKVDRAYKDVAKLRQVEAIRLEPPALPQGPFRTIVADPPWAYELRSEDLTHRGRPGYPSMSLDQIKAIPVDALAHDDSMLWLWTTNVHLPGAFGVVEAWGFRYVTMLTWAKDKPGVGDWLRGQTEHCLLAVRGRPVMVNATAQGTWFEAPRREHSQKPEAFYEIVESLCPGSKLELFARRVRAGWQSWGDEVSGIEPQAT
jgi:N6-adenosine-specific RNA methylase IME4